MKNSILYFSLLFVISCFWVSCGGKPDRGKIVINDVKIEKIIISISDSKYMSRFIKSSMTYVLFEARKNTKANIVFNIDKFNKKLTDILFEKCSREVNNNEIEKFLMGLKYENDFYIKTLFRLYEMSKTKKLTIKEIFKKNLFRNKIKALVIVELSTDEILKMYINNVRKNKILYEYLRNCPFYRELEKTVRY